MDAPVSSTNPQSLRKRYFFRALSTILIIYGLLCAAGCALQRRLIYFPTKINTALAEQAAAQRGFVPWKNTEGKTIGWRMPARGTSIGAVLIVHGNGGCALQRDYLVAPIHQAASVDVFVLEYPGYGARDGKPSLKTFLIAAEEAFDLLPKDLPKYIVSESLGTGVAAHLAQTHGTAVNGITMFVPYDNFELLAKNRMPLLPVSLILLDRFDPATWLSDYKGPIKFVVAEQDEVIPPKFGLHLHDGFHGPKDLEIIPGAHHNEASSQSMEWWQQVFTFWQQNGKPR